MDSFDTLLSKKQYDLIIKATENTTDSEALYYRIIAFASLCKFDEAINVINLNKKLLQEKSLKTLITLHIDILLLDNRFDEAYRAYDYYRELPYHSQEVEEITNAIPSKIQAAIKKSYSSFKDALSDDEIKKMLKSKDMNEVITGIDAIKDKNYLSFLNEIKDILVNFPKQSIRSFALMFLVERKHSSEVSFLSFNGMMNVVPNTLIPPFAEGDFERIQRKLTHGEKDTTLIENSIHILSSVLIYIFPHKINETDDIIIAAIHFLAKKALLQQTDIKTFAKERNISFEELNNCVISLQTYLDNF